MSWKEKVGWFVGAVLAVIFIHQVCNYDPTREYHQDSEEQRDGNDHLPTLSQGSNVAPVRDAASG